MKNPRLVLGIAFLTVLSSCSKELNETSAVQTSVAVAEEKAAIALEAIERHVNDEVLIKFKPGTTATGRANALSRINGQVKEQIRTQAMQLSGDNEGIFLVKANAGALEAISRIKDAAEVEYVEPNYIYTRVSSNDPGYTGGHLWGLYGAKTSPANQFGSHAGEAWAAGYKGSSNVVIGVIDEGVMWNHEDLSGNVKNPLEINGTSGVDDDGNGLVDDIYGWDFANNDNSVYDGSADDHGTHVAGTIGAVGGNGKGVVGMVWNVTMISAKFLTDAGGTTANAIKAVDYFTNLKAKGLNVVATNNSWGGGGFSQSLYDAIERANKAGILFIAAAGNGGSDGIGDNLDARKGTPSYPASYTNTNIIAVAAISNTGGLASFSNFGTKSVDLGAPGVSIVSTVPDHKYASYSGTSMATPHVAGAVALYASVKPGAGAGQIKNAILTSATPTTSLQNKTVTGGRLNAFAALTK